MSKLKSERKAISLGVMQGELFGIEITSFVDLPFLITGAGQRDSNPGLVLEAIVYILSPPLVLAELEGLIGSVDWQIDGKWQQA